MKKMAELLLEILSEEIPARLQLRGVEDLKSLVCTKLKDQGLSFDSVLAHVGPRRLVLVVDGLPEYQRDRIEERKGPRSNAPKKAILGFLHFPIDEYKYKTAGGGKSLKFRRFPIGKYK